MGVNTEKGATFAIGKLREDAHQIWLKNAHAIVPIIKATDGLELHEDDFSWLAEEAGIVQQYKDAWNEYRKLLNQAGDTINTIGNNLLEAADKYEQTEQDNATVLQNVASRLED